MTLDLHAIKARADAATPDWKAQLNSESDAPPYILSREGEAYWPFATALWRTHPPDRASEDAMVAQLERDFAFIAAARSDIPALCAEVERLTEENAALCPHCGDALRTAERERDEARRKMLSDTEEFNDMRQNLATAEARVRELEALIGRTP